MASYEIKLSNGSVYNIDGPDNATQAQLMGAIADNLDPVDTQVLRSKNDDFGAFLRGRAKQPRAGESAEDRDRRLFGEIKSPTVGKLEGSARAALQGGSFAFGDEVVGTGAAAVSHLTGQHPDRSFGELQGAFIDRERSKIGSFRESNPALALTAEVAGAIPTAALASPATLTGNLGARSAQAAAIGGAQGTVFGIGAGENSIKDRLKTGIETGALGAGVGAAAPTLGNIVRNVFNRFGGTAAAAKQAGTSRKSFELLRGVVDADNPSPQRLAGLGDDARLTDIGPTASGLTDYLGQRPGPSQSVVRNAVNSRVSDASGRVTAALDDTLGAPQGIRATGRQIAQSTAKARGDAYDKAFAQPIDYASQKGRDIEAVLGRVSSRTMREAVEEANEQMLEAGVKNQQVKINIADDGSIVFEELPNLEQLDALKKGLDAIGRENVDKFGRPTTAGGRAKRLATDLRDALGRAVPDYLDALKQGGDKLARDEGLDIGTKLLSARATREEIAEFVARRSVKGSLPIEVRDAVRTGLRAQIDDTLANVKRTITEGNTDAREAIKAIKDLSSRANREKVAAVLGKRESGKLFRELDRSAVAFEGQAAVAQNSKTQGRKLFDQAFGEGGGVSENLLDIRPAAALREASRAVRGRGRRADARAEELARLLMERRGAEAVRLLGLLQQPVPGNNARALAEALSRRGVAVSAPLQENLR